MADENILRPTTASIDRRVDRLEKQQEELQKTVNAAIVAIELIKTEQTHLKEIVQARFGSLDSLVSALNVKFDSLMSAINRATSDLSVTAATSKLITDEIDRLENELSKSKSEYRTSIQTITQNLEQFKTSVNNRFISEDTIRDNHKKQEEKDSARIAAIGGIVGAAVLGLLQLVLSFVSGG